MGTCDPVKVLNPRTHTQIPIPTVVQGDRWGGGGRLMEPLPRVFNMLQYFERIFLPLVESLRSSLQDEVYFMGGSAAGGLCRHQRKKSG